MNQVSLLPPHVILEPREDRMELVLSRSDGPVLVAWSDPNLVSLADSHLMVGKSISEFRRSHLILSKRTIHGVVSSIRHLLILLRVFYCHVSFLHKILKTHSGCAIVRA